MASRLVGDLQAGQPRTTFVGSVVNHFPFGTLRSGVCTTPLLCVVCVSSVCVS